jgi:hypothetical protein
MQPGIRSSAATWRLSSVPRRPRRILEGGAALDLPVRWPAPLTGALLQAGLVDEVRLMVNPIILSGGLRALETAGTVPLRLIRT